MLKARAVTGLSPSALCGQKLAHMASVIGPRHNRNPRCKPGSLDTPPTTVHPFIGGPDLKGFQDKMCGRVVCVKRRSAAAFSGSFNEREKDNKSSGNQSTLLGGDSAASQQGRSRDAPMPSSTQIKEHKPGEDVQKNYHHCHRLQHLDPQSRSTFLTLPTFLTLGRVVAVPLLVATFYLEGWGATTATTCIFVAATFTDWLDGYIARKMHLGTPFGAFLDPVADKLMVTATLVLLCTKPLEIAGCGHFPWLLTVPSITIICREITMSAVREWAAVQNTKILEAVAVNSLGKWKTATQMTALTILLAARDSSLAGCSIAVSGIVLLYVSAGLAVCSLGVYIRNLSRVLSK